MKRLALPLALLLAVSIVSAGPVVQTVKTPHGDTINVTVPERSIVIPKQMVTIAASTDWRPVVTTVSASILTTLIILWGTGRIAKSRIAFDREENEKKLAAERRGFEERLSQERATHEQRLTVDANSERIARRIAQRLRREDALTGLIGLVYQFAAAAARTSTAKSTMVSHALSKSSSLDEERQKYFAERTRLLEQTALLGAQAEKYGKLPAAFGANAYLGNQINLWAEEVTDSAEGLTISARIGRLTDDLVMDLRRVLGDEEARRQAQNDLEFTVPFENWEGMQFLKAEAAAEGRPPDPGSA